MSDQFVVNRFGIITYVNRDDQYPYVQIDGVGPKGIVLNIDQNTVIKDTLGNTLTLLDLEEGMPIEVIHSMAMTMSLPPQTYAYSITVLN